MSFSFSDLIDFSKVPIKIFILFAIVSGILLFGTDEFLAQLKLDEFEKDYGKFFGIVFIVCISFIALSIIYYIIKKINLSFFKSRVKKEVIEDIKRLDPSEQSVLREFFIMRRSTISMPMDHPIVSGLMDKYILVRKSDIGTGMYFPMALSDLAKKHLTEFDLGLRRGMSESEKQKLANNRPQWTYDFLYERANK
ncbi:Superinfection exclusion protein B [Tenacibaculum sp. MAR_2009_124]|uniref:super-infection exclusion protein B n=1 Tax=Tenacibaculum sp. MAR_2009_124 TaxID=1250059 RepID=UPI00089D81D0|nr:super-infection exclusion protein B [Tenacibaculum sp. MAR_2009_124]SEB54219.1 Superinfection exclusion protein B [Tenacibaculum sp. MAR_2009_124]